MRIKLNESNSIHTNFTNKKVRNLPIYINEKVVPYANRANYPGMTLNVKLRWKEYAKKKRKVIYFMDKNIVFFKFNKYFVEHCFDKNTSISCICITYA